MMTPEQNPQMTKPLKVLQTTLHALMEMQLANRSSPKTTLPRGLVMQSLLGANHPDSS